MKASLSFLPTVIFATATNGSSYETDQKRVSMKTSVFSFKTFAFAVAILFITSFANAVTYTWNNTAGGSWTTITKWTPTAPAGGPAAGSAIIINSNQAANITSVPTISLLSLAISGNCDFEGSASGNTVTVTGSFTVASGYTFILGGGGNRMNFTLAAGGVGTIDGIVSIVSGGSNRIFTNNGDLSISGNGLINEGSGSQGSDFMLNSGSTLRIGSASGITTTGTTGNIQVSGTRTYNSGANYYYTGSGVQATGNGLPASAITGNVTINAGSILSSTSAIIINTPGALTVNGTLTPGTATQIFSGTGTLTGTGIVQVNRTAATAGFLNQYTETTKTLTNLTVEYTVLTGAQVVSSTTYGSLKLDNTSGTNTVAGVVTVNGTLSTTAGGSLNMGTNQLQGTLANIINAGVIQSQNTSTTPIPTGKTWNGTIQFNAVSGGQTIMAGTYTNLTLGNTSGTQTAGGVLSVNVDGILTVTAGGTLNMVTYQLSGALNSISNSGIIQTQNTSSTPIPTGKTWGGTIQYNAAAGGQTIMAGTYATLLLSNSSGTQTASGDITVNTALTTTAGGYLNMATNQLLGTLTSITNGGTIQTQNTGTTPLTTGKTWGGTIQYNSTAGAQSVVTGTYSNLILSNTSGIQTASNNLTVNGALTTTSGGTLNMGTSQLLGSLTTVTNGGTIQTQYTGATPLPTGKTWGGTVQYNASSGGQTVMAGTYSTLVMGNTSGTQTASGAITLTTLNTAAGGTLNMVTYTLGGLSSVSNTGTVRIQNTSSTPFTAGLSWGGTITFDGATGQTLPASTFNNLTISNTAGVTSAGNQTVNGILSLTSNPSTIFGCLNMSTYTLEMGLNGTTSGAGDVSGIVKRTGTFVGNLPYSFGNQYTTVTFINVGTKPSWLSCKIVIGSALPHKSTSVLRYYSFAEDALTYTDQVIVNLHYLDAELQSNTENQLVLWDDDSAPGEHGKTNNNTSNNWVGLAGLPVNYLAPSISQPSATVWGLSNSESMKNTWSGASDTEWNNVANWTGGVVPTSTSDVLIPASMSRYPSLTSGSNAVASTLEIASGASLTANAQNISIYGATGAWINYGTFTPGTGTVTFMHGVITDVVSLSGTSTHSFYNLTIGSNTYFEPSSADVIKIAGTLSQGSGSQLDFTATPNTIEYNGSAQSIINPTGPGTDNGYYNLTISGSSGAKTFPSALTITGNFTNNLSGSASLTTTGSTVTFINNGSGNAQNIGGSASTTAFANLVIGNTAVPVTTTANITIASSKFLTINANAVFIPGAANTVGGSGTITGPGSGYGTAKVTRITTTPTFYGQYTITNRVLTFLTVDYAGAGNQTLNASNYSNLIISANGTRTVTLPSSGSVMISGAFNPNTSNTYIVTESTVNFNGGSSQTIPAFYYNNLTSSGNGYKTYSGSGIIGVAGTFAPGSYTQSVAGSTFDFNGGTQTIPGFIYNNIRFNTASSTKTVSGDITVDDVLYVATGVTLDMQTFALLGTLNTISNSGLIKTSVINGYTNGFPIPAGKTWGGTVEYASADAAQPVVEGTYANLTISSAIGVTATGDITVNGDLVLSANSSSFQGIFETGSYTLNMGISSTISGAGDVTGVVKRMHVFTGNTEYTFGNQYTSLTFLNTGTKPGWVSCKIAIGAAPDWRSGALMRYYSFAKDIGDDRVLVKLHYLDTEIQSETDESAFVLWDAIKASPWVDIEPQGKTGNNITQNWVSLANMSIQYVSPTSTLDDKQWGLAYTDVSTITWTGLGAFPGDWSLPGNWHGGVPKATDDVVIPSGAPYYPYRNLLSGTVPAVAKTLEIQAGASVTSDGYDITISGDANAWVNNGAFYAGTGTVTFNRGNTANAATLAGTTDFNNLVAGVNTKIQSAAGSITRIAGSLTQSSGSLIDFTTNSNTVEYNGNGSQTVIEPAGGYSTLIFSGSGIKTLPSLSIYGDLINNGTFNASGNSVTMAGSSTQVIGGSGISTFYDLTSDNAAGVILTNNEITTVTGTLLINSGKKFEINPARRLTVSGTLSNLSGTNAGLVIMSDASGTGSLVNNTIRQSAMFECYINGISWAWHFLSSPVIDQEISGNFTPTGTGNDYDFYTWYESSLLWVNFKNTTVAPTWNTANDGTILFNPGKGYLVAYESENSTKTFAGELNSGTVTYGLNYTSGTGAYKSYNLVGNPYPCSIDWKASSGWDMTNLTGTEKSFWVWNDATGNYGTYITSLGDIGTNGVSRYISPGQGFFVEAASSGDFTMEDGIKIHSGQSYLKTAEIVSEELKLTLTCDANTYSDEAIVAFNNSNPASGSGKFSSMYDAAPELWTVKNEKNYSINFLGSLTSAVIVPLSVKAGTAGSYTLSANQVESFGSYPKVRLEDRTLGIFTNLAENPAYTFQVSNPSIISGRFFLHFQETTGISDPVEAKDFSVYALDGVVNVTSLQQLSGSVTLSDMAGRKLAETSLLLGSPVRINMNGHPGVYIVTIITKTGRTNAKIIIN